MRTAKEIFQAAGGHKTLSGRIGVSEKTIEAIQQDARAEGYRDGQAVNAALRAALEKLDKAVADMLWTSDDGQHPRPGTPNDEDDNVPTAFYVAWKQARKALSSSPGSALLEAVETAGKALEAAQWASCSNEVTSWQECPSCYGEQKHAPDCQTIAALASLAPYRTKPEWPLPRP